MEVVVAIIMIIVTVELSLELWFLPGACVTSTAKARDLNFDFFLYGIGIVELSQLLMQILALVQLHTQYHAANSHYKFYVSWLVFCYETLVPLAGVSPKQLILLESIIFCIAKTILEKEQAI